MERIGGICENDQMYYMIWKTPSQPGPYTVRLDISKDGSISDSFRIHAEIHADEVIVEPQKMVPPTIYEIRIYNHAGIDEGTYYTDTVYEIAPMIEGSHELIEYIDFSVSSGWQWREDYPVMMWNTPLGPQECVITVILYDVYGDILDSRSVNVHVIANP